MLKLCIHYRGLQWSHVDPALLEYSASSWGADFIAVFDDKVKLFSEQYTNINAVRTAYPNVKFIFLACADSIPQGHTRRVLHNYNHPPDGIYFIGADDTGFELPRDLNNVDFVTIRCGTGDNRPLWSFQVANVLLYDRFAKSLA